MFPSCFLRKEDVIKSKVKQLKGYRFDNMRSHQEQKFSQTDRRMVENV